MRFIFNQFEGDQRYILYSDFTDAAEFMDGLAGIEEDREDALKDGLEKAVLRGTLLKVEYGGESLFSQQPEGKDSGGKFRKRKMETDAFLHLRERNLFRPNIFSYMRKTSVRSLNGGSFKRRGTNVFGRMDYGSHRYRSGEQCLELAIYRNDFEIMEGKRTNGIY